MHISNTDVVSEVWNPFCNLDYEWDSSGIESVQLHFSKHILGVNRSTTNTPLLGELGQIAIKTTCDLKNTEFCQNLSNSYN